QYYVPVPQYGLGQRPLLSPYLNLVNPSAFGPGFATPGGTASFLAPLNYYNLTLPEQQRRANQANIYGQLDQIELGGRAAPPAPGDEISELTRPISATGHPTYFNTTGAYFPAQRA